MSIPLPHFEVWSKRPDQLHPVLLGSGPPKHMEPLFFAEARSPEQEVVLVEHAAAGMIEDNEGFGEVIAGTAFILARNNYQPISIREEMFHGKPGNPVIDGSGQTDEGNEGEAEENGAWEGFW